LRKLAAPEQPLTELKHLAAEMDKPRLVANISNGCFRARRSRRWSVSRMARRVRVALIGGGIGGLISALALSRRGFEPLVFEQSCELKEIGAGIQITPNSVKVLRALGLEDDLRNYAFEPEAMVTRDLRSGQLLFRTQSKGVTAGRFGAPWFQIHRADFLTILLRALSRNYLHLAARCTSVISLDRGVMITLSDGREVEADLAVGCDGIHSFVRRALHGAQSPRFTGNICWRALIPAERLPKSHIEPSMNYWTGPREHIVAYYVRGGQLVNLVAVRETKPWVEESWLLQAQACELVKAYPDAHGDLKLLLQAVQDCFKWGLFDRDPLPNWSKGRVTLLGDAAHPMLPFLSQGAAMAIEDGYVLARELANSPEDIAAALKAYEAERLPRTAKVQLAARVQGNIFHLHSPLARLKRFLGLDRFGEQNADLLKKDWVFDYDPTLPDFASTMV
jgi:salicylate hydroxylase